MILVPFVTEDSEELDPGGGGSSEGNKENSPQPGSKGVLLSRRQKKNRVRRDDGSPVGNQNASAKKNKARPRRSPNSGDGNGSRRYAPVLRQHTKLNLTDSDLSVFLRQYTLNAHETLALGYPVESSLYPGKAVIYKSPNTNTVQNPAHALQSPLQTSSHFDVNAQEFVPKAGHYYSDINNMYFSNYICPAVNYNVQDRENNNVFNTLSYNQRSSNCMEGLCKDVPTRQQDTTGNSIIGSEKQELKSNVVKKQLSSSDEKRCVRCQRGFFVTVDGEYLTQEQCLYHWGKLQKVIGTKEGSMAVRMEYSCCHGKPSTRGCTTGKLHVWNGVGPGVNGPFDGYVRTRLRKTPPPDGNFGVYALDCEMCFTTCGLELTKVTVVGADGRLVYDSLVRPENYIIDYNTRFSGITARDLSKRATKTLKDVQNDLMGFINADTILIGHGLENDLRALHIIHGTVIDTSVVFPHFYGLPYRRSLKSLAGCFLKRKIQEDSSGHDSFEDARACIELMLWRVRRDYRSILENRTLH